MLRLDSSHSSREVLRFDLEGVKIVRRGESVDSPQLTEKKVVSGRWSVVSEEENHRDTEATEKMVGRGREKENRRGMRFV